MKRIELWVIMRECAENTPSMESTSERASKRASHPDTTVPIPLFDRYVSIARRIRELGAVRSLALSATPGSERDAVQVRLTARALQQT